MVPAHGVMRVQVSVTEVAKTRMQPGGELFTLTAVKPGHARVSLVTKRAGEVDFWLFVASLVKPGESDALLNKHSAAITACQRGELAPLSLRLIYQEDTLVRVLPDLAGASPRAVECVRSALLPEARKALSDAPIFMAQLLIPAP